MVSLNIRVDQRINYHLSPHLMPWVPFYYFPKVHRVIAADLVLGGTGFLYRGYHRLLFAALFNVPGCVNDV